MTITYSGQYPGVEKDYSLALHSKKFFNLIHRENRIEDYRMTSVLNLIILVILNLI